MTKKISKSGSVHLPKELRSELGISTGCAVDIDTDGETIAIRKHVPICRFCGSVKSVVSVLEIEICKECAIKIKEKADKM